ncbi:MAG: hypothetical protein ABSF77_20705 [Spirochaetia bacterium]
MSLRSKLTVGLGFLFVIILAITVYSSLQIEKLSKEANTILRDNYDSLVYCKNMLIAIDDINLTVSNKIFGPNQKKTSVYDSNLFEQSKSSFENSLNAEKNNITEVSEKEYVDALSESYVRYLNLYLQIIQKGGNSTQYFGDVIPTYSSVRSSIVKINDLNMQAVERKSQLTGHDAGNMIISMAVIGTICILLAFFYFWYFPFYVSNTVSVLAKKMKELFQKVGIKMDTTTSDEAFILLHAINLLENKLVQPKRARKRNEA